MADKKQPFWKQLFSGQRTNPRPTETVGAPGTAVYSGYIEELEKNPALRGRERYRTYSQIVANTAIVAAGVRLFLNFVQRVQWNLSPADDSPAAAEIAELVEDILHDMETPWSRVVKRAALYKLYGFSVQEWTAKRREDGNIGLLDIAPRAQITIEKWDIDPTGRVLGCVQRSPQDSREIYLPREKILYVVDDSLNDSPEGLGVLRHVVDPALRLDRYEQLEGFGFETDLRGVPVGRQPYSHIRDLVEGGTLTEQQAAQILEPLQQFIKKHIKTPQLGILLDSVPYRSTDEGQTPSSVPQFDIDLMKSSSSNLGEMAAAIERQNHEIARVLGVEQLMLGQSRGTQALSEDKTYTFAMMVDSTLTEIEEAVQRDIIDQLFVLNGWDPALKPELRSEQQQFRDPSQITQALKDMAAAMLDPDDPAINTIRGLLGLPDALPTNSVLDAALTAPEGNDFDVDEDGVEDMEEEQPE